MRRGGPLEVLKESRCRERECNQTDGLLQFVADYDRLHTLSAEELHTAHLTPYLQQTTAILEARLKDTQEENGALMRRITEQRLEIESLVQGLEGVVADLEDSIEAMRDDAGGGMDGLRAEIWEMEGEMRAAAEG